MEMTTTIKERPILFRGEMVQAILDGRKTMTRRIVKGEWFYDGETGVGAGWEPPTCPYGNIGDRLWVRETWAANAFLNLRKPSELKGEKIYYRATYSNDSHFVWRPSIHMPRWACRLFLEITDVRIEPLNDISEEDAISEGVLYTGAYPAAVACGFLPRPKDLARREFRKLWESIHGAGSWSENPLVWVVEFRKEADRG